MSYLLDTHTFLWFLNGDKELSRNARAHISNASVPTFISIASFWEMAIKLRSGKLILDMPFAELKQHVSDNGWRILPITFEDTQKVTEMPRFPDHGDPFDRIIIAQGMLRHLTIITKDCHFSKYKVKTLW